MLVASGHQTVVAVDLAGMIVARDAVALVEVGEGRACGGARNDLLGRCAPEMKEFIEPIVSIRGAI